MTKKKLLLFFFISTQIQAATIRQSWSLLQVLDSFGYYKTINNPIHSGNLLEHAIWTCRALAAWFDTKHPWVQDLGEIEDLVLLGGLLHDLGKAGDLVFLYQCKHSHPVLGVEYLLQKKQFCLNYNNTLNVEQLFGELSLSLQEQKMLAVFVAMHLKAGDIIKQIKKQGLKCLEKEVQGYLKQLCYWSKKTGLGEPTLMLLKATLAISAADVKGLQPHSYCNQKLVTLLGQQHATGHHAALYKRQNGYDKFETERLGLKIRAVLIKYFEDKNF